MIRREPIDGHATILATLDPKDGVKPQTDDGKIMRNFKARAWISESDYELVRIEIEAIHDLSFGMGLLARVHKGTIATFERRKVNNEVWLPAKVTWTASGRVLLLRRLRLRGISEFSEYRKFTVDTSATFGQPKYRCALPRFNAGTTRRRADCVRIFSQVCSPGQDLDRFWSRPWR